MKVLWFYPPSKIEGKVPMVGNNRWFKYMPTRTNAIYPIIASYGATMIKDVGHSIDFLDCVATPKTLEEIPFDDYDIVISEGITVMMPWLWEITDLIKKTCPTTKVVLYGDHVVCKPQESLDKGVDYIINCGDYDYGALKLVESLEKGESINPDFRYPNMADLDSLPFADRDLVPWKNYWETWRHRDEFGWYQSSRGCWGKCSFCSWVYNFYNSELREFSVERIVNEVEYATKKYGIREFLDDADTFLPNWGHRYAEELIARDLDIFWNVQTRADTALTATIEQWKMMKTSGLHVVKFGIDGGSDYTLKRIQKGYNRETVEKAFKHMKKAGIETHLNMIICFPWETEKDVADMIRWVKKLSPNQAQFSVVQPFIGTPIHDEAIKNNWFLFDPEDYERWDMSEPIIAEKMNVEQIREAYKKAWKSFYFSPKFIVWQLAKSIRLCIHHKNTDALRHLWRGYKGVKNGHLKVMDE